MKLRMLWYKRTKASIMLQKTFRGYKDRSVWRRKKAVLKIQLWYRFAKAMKWIRAVQDTFKDAPKDPYFGKYLVWPTNISVMNRGAELVKQIHQSWRVRKLLGTLDAPKKEAMRTKILAYDLFHGKKPYSFSRSFAHDYTEKSEIPLPKYQKLISELPGSKQVLFANAGMKINSKGGLDMRFFVVTDSHIHSCKKLALRDSLALDQIASISMNALEEWTVVVHAKPPGRDFVLNFFNLEALEETSTEFVTLLQVHARKAGGLIKLDFSDKITCANKKPSILSFQPNLQAVKFSVKSAKGNHTLIYPEKRPTY